MDEQPDLPVPTLPGPALLRAWRGKRSQAVIAHDLGISQSLLSQREDGTRKVPLGDALLIQAVTEGAIPATAWGHSEEAVALALSAGDYPPPASVPTASDFTVDSDAPRAA